MLGSASSWIEHRLEGLLAGNPLDQGMDGNHAHLAGNHRRAQFTLHKIMPAAGSSGLPLVAG